ncbi:DUF4214 domain-containing protein [Marivita sp.]|uniref:DUF4214 domain-containing protein n=1 Tax=Marivita sp. TaxID=2003365 RepID=UPI003A839CF4
MSFTLSFDYRFDSTGFFDDPARRSALEAAAAQWQAIIEDDFADVPAGTEFEIRNPTTFATETVRLDQPIDDILIFVGARAFDSSTLAIAGPDGGTVTGDIYAARISQDFRGSGAVTDFEPWTGSITFNSRSNWSFALDGPVSGRSDFVSVAIHEIGHILGIGTSAAFDQWIRDGHFTGPNATWVNNGQPIPIEDDHAHVEEGFADNSVALDPILTTGSRVVLSAYDAAMLADIGYQIAGFDKQGSTPALATPEAERIFGTDLADSIDAFSGNDSIQGAGGDDHLDGNAGQDDLFGQSGNDTLFGGDGDDYLDGGAGNDELRGGPGADVYFGHAGQDVFVIAAGDGGNRLSDFDLDEDTIRLIDSGFSSAEDVLAAISKPFNNVSRITFTDGTTVDVFHGSQSGTPLTETHLFLEKPGQVTTGENDPVEDVSRPESRTDAPSTTPPIATFLEGSSYDDYIVATAGHDRIDGFDGIDTVQFSGHQSRYTIEFGANGLSVTDRGVGGLGSVHLDNIELIDFEFPYADFGGSLDLRLFGGHTDLDQAAMDTFVEMYIAYFNRAPDAVGLAFWGTAFANGTPLEEIAVLFAEQDETAALYPNDFGNLRFISEIYNNVLGRAPDMEGLLFWEAALDSGFVSRGAFILELLMGAKADLPASATASLIARQAEDQRYLEMKTDLGVRFALDRGMSDTDAATQVMQIFDGSTESFERAGALIDDLYSAALDPESGSFLMPLIGIHTDFAEI